MRNSGLEFQNCTIRLDGSFEATASRATLSQQGSRLAELWQFSGVLQPRPTSLPCIRCLDAASSEQFASERNAHPLRRATALARGANLRVLLLRRDTEPADDPAAGGEGEHQIVKLIRPSVLNQKCAISGRVLLEHYICRSVRWKQGCHRRTLSIGTVWDRHCVGR
jgi:hypothetical protein